MASNPLQRATSNFFRRLEYFAHLETSGGIVLILCTIIALVWANSPWFESYFAIAHIDLTLQFGSFVLSHSIGHWVNDGLMVLFFFVVGLEIKREIVLGELSSRKKATLPVLAAVGGMVAPALIYFFFNPEGAASRGWGIPMATDIAFAVGVLTLLGKSVPLSLRIFLLALAVIDDLGAILVIAIFYASDISIAYLAGAGGLLAFTYFLNLAGIRNILSYVLVGILVWFCLLKSGVHATIAGVLLGLLTPTHAWYLKDIMVNHVRDLSQKVLETIKLSQSQESKLLLPETQTYLNQLKHVVHESEPPLDRLVRALHPWVTFFIMPVFAFFNAGVRIENIQFIDLVQNPVYLGIAFGLLIGKPLGITLVCYLAVKAGLAQLPAELRWSHVLGVSCLAGIGFTMALFISGLALGTAAGLDTFAKTGILSGSLLSAIVGCIVLYRATHSKARG